MRSSCLVVGLVLVTACGDDSGAAGSGGGSSTTSGVSSGGGSTTSSSASGSSTSGGSTSGSSTSGSSTSGSSTGAGGEGGSGGTGGATTGTGGGGGGDADRIFVPGGEFDRQNDPSLPATVSEFYLDRHEVTVERFRVYVATLGDAERAELLLWFAGCDGATWTDAPGANEDKPINCVLRADGGPACAALGGRLPTELEWNFAAAGGEEQRFFPWSDPPADEAIDATHAVYQGSGDGEVLAVGSKPAGAGRWGHLDLAGNVWEMLADSDNALYVTEQGCDDCSFPGLPSEPRYVRRGGAFDSDESRMQNDSRDGDSDDGVSDIGLRCAYDEP